MARRVVVAGLGVTGEAVVRRLHAAGDDVLVVEDRPGGAGYDERAAAVRALGIAIVERPESGGSARLLAGRDLLVPSPGVPEHHSLLVAARDLGVDVRPEVELAAERADARGIALAGVTGTNGKTTVTTLLTAMLTASGIEAVAAGNIGTPLIDAVETDVTVVVAELSSFQLNFTSSRFRPRVALVLNVAADHLDWHGSFERYADAKARIFAHQHTGDLLVANADDAEVRERAGGAPGRRVEFSLEGRPGTVHARDGAIVAGDDTVLARLPARSLLRHERANALAAAAAALDLGATRAGIERALENFERLPHRVAQIGENRGVRYFDDSKATNPHATLAALQAFDEPVVLLAGGLNKDLDLSVLATEAARVRAVVAIGAAAADVESAFAPTACEVTRAASMREAVAVAARLARPGDVVLLSPACASFDWYGSYAERGDDFAREVAQLVPEGAAS
jgi:UDP-N-acetylmuramoylalanine--D-glutamate ligase